MRAWFIALAGAACTPSGVATTDPSDALSFVGLVDVDLGLTGELGPVPVRAGAPVTLPLIGARTVAVRWSFAAGYFVDPEGRPLDLALRTPILRGVGGEPKPGHGACGTCPAPAFDADVQTVHPGASCAIGTHPERVEVEAIGGDPELFARAEKVAREHVRLDWTGSCGCPEPPPAPESIELAPIAPGVATWPHRGVVETPDGHIVLVDERHAISISPTGTVTETREIPIEDTILTAISGGTNEIYIATYKRLSMGATWWITDTSFSSWREGAIDPLMSFTPESGAPVPGARGEMVVAGAVRAGGVNFPKLLACGPDVAGAQCREVARSISQIDPSARFTRTFQLPDRSWIAITNTGTFVHVDHIPRSRSLGSAQLSTIVERGTYAYADGVTSTSSTPVLWRLYHADLIDAGGAMTAINSITGAATVGQTLYMCAQLDANKPVVLRRSFARNVLDNDRPYAGLEVVACRPKQASCGFVATTGTVTVASIGGDMLRFDEAGFLGDPKVANAACDASFTPGPLSIFSAFARLEQWRTDRWIGVDRAGAAWVGEVGRSPRAVYGSPARRPEWNALARDRRTNVVWGFGPEGMIARIEGSTMTIEPAIGLPAIRSAAVDHRTEGAFMALAIDGRVVRVTRTSTGIDATFIDIPGQELQTFESREVWVPSAYLVTEPADGTFVLGMSPRGFVRVVGEEVTPIDMDFDDPATPDAEIDSEVVSRCIEIGRVFDYSVPAVRQDLELRSLASAGGVAWAVGCRNKIYRVSPFGDRPVAYAYAENRVLRQEASEAHSLALAARCADRALFLHLASGSNMFSLGYFFEVKPSSTPEAILPALWDVEIELFRRLPGNLDTLIELEIAKTYAISLDHDPPAYALSGEPQHQVPGAVARFEQKPYRLSAPVRAMAETASGGFVVSLEGGEVLASPP